MNSRYPKAEEFGKGQDRVDSIDGFHAFVSRAGCNGAPAIILQQIPAEKKEEKKRMLKKRKVLFGMCHDATTLSKL